MKTVSSKGRSQTAGAGDADKSVDSDETQLKQWLLMNGRAEYHLLLISEGIVALHVMQEISNEQELVAIGIQKPEHINKLWHSILKIAKISDGDRDDEQKEDDEDAVNIDTDASDVYYPYQLAESKQGPFGIPKEKEHVKEEHGEDSNQAKTVYI